MGDIIKKETFIIKLTYEMSVNTDTGEILETKLIDRSIDNSDIKVTKSSTKKKIVQDNDKEPKLFLEDNKYKLNNAAIELMNLDEDSRLNISYMQGKDGDFPVICEVDNGGNRISKSNTVSFRGNKNSELSKYGNEFVLVPYLNDSRLFVLTPKNIKIEQLVGDDNVSIEGGEDEDIPFDLDIKGLVDNEDMDVTEIDSNFFKF